MTYVASVVHRAAGTWDGADADLGDIEDLDGLADLIRDTAAGADLALLLLDEDDEYLAVVRVDRDSDPLVFVSDSRALEGDGIAGRLLAEAAVQPEVEPDEDEDKARPTVEPAGDPSLLTDLGIDTEGLLALCAAEGLLPADVLFALGEKVGFAEVLEGVRGV